MIINPFLSTAIETEEKKAHLPFESATLLVSPQKETERIEKKSLTPFLTHHQLTYITELAVSNFKNLTHAQFESFVNKSGQVQFEQLQQFLLQFEKRSNVIDDGKRASSRVKDILPFLNSLSVGTLLDIGSGDASITTALGHHLKLAKSNIYALDVKEVKNPNVTPVTYTANGKIPLDDKSVDLVLMMVSFHHVPIKERPLLLKEIRRVLKSEGRVVIREHDRPTDDQEAINFDYMESLIHGVYTVIEGGNELEFQSYLSAEDLSATFSLNGLNGMISPFVTTDRTTNVQRIYYNGFTPYRLFSPEARIEYTLTRKISERNPIDSSLLFSYTDDKRWLREMVTQLYNLVGPAYLSKSKLPMWVKAFTHPSWSNVNNNDELRYFGKSLIMNLVSIFIYDTCRSLDQSHYTYIRNYLTSKEKMEQYGRSLIPLMRRRDLGIKDGYQAEVYPSFLANIYLTSEDESKGLIKSKELIFNQFNKEELDVSTYTEDASTQITQLFSVLRAGGLKHGFIVQKNNNQISVILSDYGKQELLSKGARQEVYHLRPVVKTGVNTREARRAAYQEMYELLNSLGINLAWARNVQSAYNLKRSGLTNKGYIRLDIVTAKKNTVMYDGEDYRVIQAVGTNINGKKKVIKSLIYNIQQMKTTGQKPTNVLLDDIKHSR